jgi:spore germination protein YaaH
MSMQRLRNLALVLLIAGAPVVAITHPVAAMATRSASSAVMPLTLSSNRPQREVFGFVNAGNLGNASVGFPSWNLSLLTTVAYFALHVNSGDGHLVDYDTGWKIFHSQTMTNFVNAAHANGVRVIVSLNLHDFGTSSTSQVCQGLTSTSAQYTITQAVAEVAAAHIDGINMDYEATNTTCADGATSRDEMTAMVKNLRAAMPNGYLAIDTYAGSAEDNLEFFDITGLQPYVDSFFVMAYDSDFSNYSEVPLSCSAYCFNPVSPLNTYRFNATKSMAQYMALVPAKKIILGQPYYGRKACVPQPDIAHQYLDLHQYQATPPNFVTMTYLDAVGVATDPAVSGLHTHRDPGDGVTEWDTWWSIDFGCWREQYWDDVTSLSAKYNLVNTDNLGGVGLFTLDYGGGSPELWSALSTYFSCPVTLTLAASQTTTEFSVGLSAGSCSVAYYEVQQYDSTSNQGWFDVGPVAGGASAVVVEGFAGHTYQFRARAHSNGGVVSSWAGASTTLSASPTASHPFTGLFTLDGWGGLHADSSPPINSGAYWPGWNIARSAHAQPGATAPQSGLELDGWGGLHPYGAGITSVTTTGYWPYWDIARDFAFMPDGSGGFVLDGWGGLHPFHVNGSAAPLAAQTTAYWQGWDIARKVVIFPDGTGGYVLDGWGGVHAFGINGPAPVATTKLVQTGFWPNWDIAHDIVLIPGNGNHSGYVLDGWGGVHAFHPSGDGSTLPAEISTAFWRGWDIARAMWLLPGSATAGYTLDGWGGLHPFGGAPQLMNTPTWPGWDIAKSIWGA